MGKLTLINSNNIIYFEGLIGDYYLQRDANDSFVGYIDDEDNAVSAACVNFKEDFAYLKFIATDPKEQRKGYGLALLNGIKKTMENGGIRYFRTHIYMNEENMDEYSRGFVGLLSQAGFEQIKMDMKRCSYTFDSLKEIKAEDVIDYEVKAGNELTFTELESLEKIIEQYGDTPLYITKNFLADNGCIFMTRNGEVSCFVHTTPLDKYVVVDSIYAPSKNMKILNVLYKKLYDKYKSEYPEDATVLIDTYGEKLLEYQKMIIKADAIEELQGYCYSFEI